MAIKPKVVKEVKSEKGNGGRLVRVGAGWAKESKDGGTYYSVQLGDKETSFNDLADYTKDGRLRLLIFDNKYKKEEKHPDVLIYIPIEDE